MKTHKILSTSLLSLAALAIASCGSEAVGESPRTASGKPFTVTEKGRFDEPWAIAFEPGTGNLFITQKQGKIVFLTEEGQRGTVSGVPSVAYGGQGGLGDFVFAPDYASSKAVYLSWAEAGDGDTRGAAVGRATLSCAQPTSCALDDLKVIWRQTPKVTGRGHYSHRIAFSPDGTKLFIASGERQKMQPAQDMNTNLGKVLRLELDGTPAPGNPFADRGSPANQIWSYGHRNILGLAFDAQGRLWDLEHGPAGGDELNLVKPGANYGWPLVSDGDHYSGEPIPRNSTRPDLAAPAISWNPVIAPGNFIFYSGNAFPEWKGDLLTPGLKTQSLVRVRIEGETAKEVARYDMGGRMRAIAQGPDGAIWLIGDEANAPLLKLTPDGK